MELRVTMHAYKFISVFENPQMQICGTHPEDVLAYMQPCENSQRECKHSILCLVCVQLVQSILATKGLILNIQKRFPRFFRKSLCLDTLYCIWMPTFKCVFAYTRALAGKFTEAEGNCDACLLSDKTRDWGSRRVGGLRAFLEGDITVSAFSPPCLLSFSFCESRCCRKLRVANT